MNKMKVWLRPTLYKQLTREVMFDGLGDVFLLGNLSIADHSLMTSVLLGASSKIIHLITKFMLSQTGVLYLEVL